MIVAKVIITSNEKAITTYKNKQPLKSYTKRDVLKVLCLYSKWHCPFGSEMLKVYLSKLRSAIFKARCEFGTQFLLDLFIMTEVYMNHWPCFAMHQVRADITYVLN